MTRRRFMQILLSAACVLIIIGATLAIWVMSTDAERNVIDVRLKNGETKTLRFEDLALIPGGSSEYVVVLNRGASKNYDLTLRIKSIGKDNQLKHFARVRIEADGAEICDELLDTLIKSRSVSFPVDLTKNRSMELRIVCYLPLEVGNEAQNATADFEILLSASNE